MNHSDICSVAYIFTMMGSSPLDLYAREYFTSLNSIANKISTDISNAVAAYEDLWHTLNIKDQRQIINETIIHPNVVLKYTLFQPEEYKINKKTSSQHYFVDEGKALSWPDEHAAPFSWKTRSQEDLSVFNDNEQNTSNVKFKKELYKPKNDIGYTHSSFDSPNVVLGGSSSKLITKQNDSQISSECSSFSIKNKSKSVVLRIQATVPAPNKRGDNRHKALSMTESDNMGKHGNLCKSSRTSGKPIPKPKSPPPPPPPKQKLNQNGFSCINKEKERSVSLEPTKCIQSNISETDVSSSLDDFHFEVNVPSKCDTLPKTGFDFLDNW